ncbi:hypothetical protein PMAYCL1PPCAC_08080 [Pristionchus mayeri]|uniref:Uncharacterized protein n=1 Tax=Pristionchus mayeri TaxID=1317129 RepID=A0AAN4ZHP5_9BILA|nr:hypothetical protein PMAYCL1PPCAC_08080 [Pristionchus mayeri]
MDGIERLKQTPVCTGISHSNWIFGKKILTELDQLSCLPDDVGHQGIDEDSITENSDANNASNNKSKSERNRSIKTPKTNALTEQEGGRSAGDWLRQNWISYILTHSLSFL